MAFFCLLFFLTGCIKMNVLEQVNTSGLSNVTVTMDLSGLSDMSEMPDGTNSIPIPDLDPDQLCDDILNPNPTPEMSMTISMPGVQELSNVDCQATEEGVVTITGTYQYPKEAITSQEDFLGTTYSFDPTLGSLIEFPKSDTPPLELGESFASVAALKAAGFEMTYQVELPGMITNAQNGIIQNNKAEFDMVALAISSQTPLVQSTNYNLTTIGLIAGSGIVALISIIFLVRRKRKSKEHYYNAPPNKESKKSTIAREASSSLHYDPRNGPPRSGQQRTPRRLKRFERKGETSPQKEYFNDPYAELYTERDASSFGTVLHDLKKESRHGKDHATNELDTLAQNITDQTTREQKKQKELEELKTKLGRLSGEGNEETGYSSRKHGRFRDRYKKEEIIENPKPAESSDSQAQLDKLKQMEFKELLGEKKEGTEDSELGEIEELEKIEKGETPSKKEETQKCPNCQKETDQILYCHECGTGFCSSCASSFKKQDSQTYYTCPTCQTKVKEQ
ncbi:hypothetical protein KKE06_01220 [Candidatus Micrarchaeota archaeon]|nr:hypothetical protein [Candidatus Micrarchaeota archaeon]